MTKLPRFKSEAEEANFWATHELTDHDEDLKPADVMAVRSADQVVAVRLNKDDVVAIKRIARHKGVGYTTLVRMWVREKLDSAGR